MRGFAVICGAGFAPGFDGFCDLPDDCFIAVILDIQRSTALVASGTPCRTRTLSHQFKFQKSDIFAARVIFLYRRQPCLFDHAHNITHDLGDLEILRRVNPRNAHLA